MYKIFSALLLISLLFVGCGNDTAKEISLESINVDKIEKITNDEILESINNLRVQRIDCKDGLGLVGPVQPLIWNDNLYASAYEHSNDLSQSNIFSHDGSGTEYDVTGTNNNSKSSFVDRIQASGYVDYHIVGENIAAGYTTVEEVIEALVVSPKHCTNLMSSQFKEVGVAISINESTEYKIYWSQDFGARR